MAGDLPVKIFAHDALIALSGLDLRTSGTGTPQSAAAEKFSLRRNHHAGTTEFRINPRKLFRSNPIAEQQRRKVFHSPHRCDPSSGFSAEVRRKTEKLRSLPPQFPDASLHLHPP